VRDKNVDLYSDLAPTNLSERLQDNQINVVGLGHNPRDVLALSFSEKTLGAGTSRAQEEVHADTRDFWVTKNSKGDLDITELEHSKLTREARVLFLRQASFAQTQQRAYTLALSDTLKAMSTSSEGPLRDEAAKLLKARGAALEKLKGIDDQLSEALEKAAGANKAADVFAIMQTLAGAGSQVLSASSKQSDSKRAVEGTVHVQRMSTPSGDILEVIKLRVKAEGDVVESNVQTGKFMQQNNKTIYVPVRP
jgi:hypothetical protein